MILRKPVPAGVGQTGGLTAGGPLNPRNASTLPTRSWQLVLVIFAGFLVVIFMLSRAASSMVDSSPGGNSPLRTPLVASPPPTAAETIVESLDNCPLIKQLLDGEIPSSKEGLPSAGKPTNFGAVFWLKTPVLRASLPDSKADVVLLKYNKYLPKQHTLKWSNTVSILKTHRDGRVFPKMYAYCKDPGDGYHYILVEWIDLHPSELSKPKRFDQCFDRATGFVNMLVTLDEEMHLTLMDVKKGQWMSRPDQISFVLQDVDDIVHSPWTPSKHAGDLYFDQVEHAMSIVQSNVGPRTASGYVKKLWEEEFFPNGYTIRYTMVLLGDIILGDMGFHWESACSEDMPPKFMPCLREALKWAASPGADWPAPKQILWAMEECRARGAFDKKDSAAQRPPAPWRDQPKKPVVPPVSTYISCYRASDPVKKTDASYTENVSWCRTDYENDGQAVPIEGANSNETSQRTCCRSKGNTPCYYHVTKQDLCK